MKPCTGCSRSANQFSRLLFLTLVVGGLLKVEGILKVFWSTFTLMSTRVSLPAPPPSKYLEQDCCSGLENGGERRGREGELKTVWAGFWAAAPSTVVLLHSVHKHKHGGVAHKQCCTQAAPSTVVLHSVHKHKHSSVAHKQLHKPASCPVANHQRHKHCQ